MRSSSLSQAKKRNRARAVPSQPFHVDAAVPDHFRAFVRHFNARRYREALLAVEQCWLVERDQFHQGLVQLCCALNQMQLGQSGGPTFLLQRARKRLAPFAPQHGGLNVSRLLTFIAECEALVRTDGASVEPPPLRLRRLPRPKAGTTYPPH